MPVGHLVTITPQSLVNVFQDKTQWQWISGVTEDPGEDTFGEDGNMIGNIQGYLLNRSLLIDAVVFFKGYSYVGADLKLHRKMPSFHPRWPWSRCTNVSIKGIIPRGQESPPGPYFYEDSLPCPIYDKYRFSVHYEGLPYDVRSDASVADYVDTPIAPDVTPPVSTSEWNRFITVDPVDEVEIITQEGGMFRYVSSTYAGINGVPFLGPAIQVRAQRSGLMVTAYGVAADLIMDQFNIPTKFLQAKSLVNSRAFLGKPPETMLLAGYKITKKPQYVATQDITGNGNGLLLFGCKIEMHFTFTDPAATDPAETHRGWNLVPGPGGVGWFYVATPATILGFTVPSRSLYYKCNMNALLTHHTLNDLQVTA